jgi:hypothetical protein
MFQRAHPDCDLIFAYDNSSNHRRAPPDGLNAYDLNKSDGGGNNKHRMRNTVWNGAHFPMQTAQEIRRDSRQF